MKNKMKNKMKKKILSGQPAFGLSVMFPSTQIVEMVGTYRPLASQDAIKRRFN